MLLTLMKLSTFCQGKLIDLAEKGGNGLLNDYRKSMQCSTLI